MTQRFVEARATTTHLASKSMKLTATLLRIHSVDCSMPVSYTAEIFGRAYDILNLRREEIKQR